MSKRPSVYARLVSLHFDACHPAMTSDIPKPSSLTLECQSFPDPCLIRTNDGWHAFSTNYLDNGKWTHVQVAYTPDWKTWTLRTGKDAMPTLASWIDPVSPRVWAPDVVQLQDGSFIMYYTAGKNAVIHSRIAWTHGQADGGMR